MRLSLAGYGGRLQQYWVSNAAAQGQAADHGLPKHELAKHGSSALPSARLRLYSSPFFPPTAVSVVPHL